MASPATATVGDHSKTDGTPVSWPARPPEAETAHSQPLEVNNAIRRLSRRHDTDRNENVDRQSA